MQRHNLMPHKIISILNTFRHGITHAPTILHEHRGAPRIACARASFFLDFEPYGTAFTCQLLLTARNSSAGGFSTQSQACNCYTHYQDTSPYTLSSAQHDYPARVSRTTSPPTQQRHRRGEQREKNPVLRQQRTRHTVRLRWQRSRRGRCLGWAGRCEPLWGSCMGPSRAGRRCRLCRR